MFNVCNYLLWCLPVPCFHAATFRGNFRLCEMKGKRNKARVIIGFIFNLELTFLRSSLTG
jgi:hypothetical protein